MRQALHLVLSVFEALVVGRGVVYHCFGGVRELRELEKIREGDSELVEQLRGSFWSDFAPVEAQLSESRATLVSRDGLMIS